MEVDFLEFYLDTGRDVRKLVRYCQLGRIKKITVDEKNMRYKLSKQNKDILKRLAKNGIIVVWKK